MMAAAPVARGLRTQLAEEAVNDRLYRLLEKAGGCRERTWWWVYEHSSQPGIRSARPGPEDCGERGHPLCREGRQRRKVARHRSRLKLAYPPGELLGRLRLDAREGIGPADVFKLWGLFRRKRTVKPLFPPALAGLMPGPTGCMGLTLLLRSCDQHRDIGQQWIDATGGSWRWEPVPGDADQEALRLRVESDAAIFELVDVGILDPRIARQWLKEEIEIKNKRAIFVGGFLGLGVVSASSPEAKGDDDGDEISTEVGQEYDDPIDAGIADLTTIWEHWQRVAFPLGALISRFHSIRQQVSGHPREHLLKEVAMRLLDQIPDEAFNCKRHHRCEETPMGRHLRASVLIAAAVSGKAVQVADDEYEWTDDSWPGWRDRTKRIPKEYRDHGR